VFVPIRFCFLVSDRNTILATYGRHVISWLLIWELEPCSDTFFHCVIFHGETIAAWREQGYHEQEEHAAFRALLEAPQADAQLIMDARFPVPRYIVCDQHKSEARFLMAKLNPSTTHNSNLDGAGGGTQVNTDDVSLRVFMEHCESSQYGR
jgi:Gelsolin repeat